MTEKYRAFPLAWRIYAGGSFSFHHSCRQPKEPPELLMKWCPRALC